jgi:hypothetical protein
MSPALWQTQAMSGGGADKNIACRVVRSAVAVCDIHAEESDREPGGRPLHRARARVHAADAGEETGRISNEIVNLVANPRSALGPRYRIEPFGPCPLSPL